MSRALTTTHENCYFRRSIPPVFGRLVVQPGLGARHRLHQEEVCVEPQNP
jgi:hypothetical protein